MATYKRRIVYLSDEEWKSIEEAAGRHGTTISAYIRSVVGKTGLGRPLIDPTVLGVTEPEADIAATRTQVARDRQYAEPGFNSRPFTPVPKRK